MLTFGNGFWKNGGEDALFAVHPKYKHWKQHIFVQFHMADRMIPIMDIAYVQTITKCLMPEY